MTFPKSIETPQQRADRLLQEELAARRASHLPLGTAILPTGYPPSRWSRFKRAARPWVAGFDHPVMDALGLAFLLIISATLGAFAAMCWADNAAPPASGAYSATMEATSRPAAVPHGGGAIGEAR